MNYAEELKKNTRNFVLTHEKVRSKKWGHNDMNETTLCGGVTMKGEKCMMSSTKMEKG